MRMNPKQMAALRALEEIRPGMRLGLGSGSTVRFFIQALGEHWQAGELQDLKCVATSEATAAQASALGLPVTSLSDFIGQDQVPCLDLAVDGADEVDPNLNLIKGLGMAALREKMVEMHADRFLVIVDESKLVNRLGRGPLPVEIVQFEAVVTVKWLMSLGCRADIWCDEKGKPFVTDNGNWLVRCWFQDGIGDAVTLERHLNNRPGVVGHGLFLGMADEIIVAGSDGTRILTGTEERVQQNG